MASSSERSGSSLVQRRVHRGGALVQAEHSLDVLDRLVQQAGNLLRRGLVVELL